MDTSDCEDMCLNIYKAIYFIKYNREYNGE